jgi:hypothetical protein
MSPKWTNTKKDKKRKDDLNENFKNKKKDGGSLCIQAYKKLTPTSTTSKKIFTHIWS